MYAKYEDMKQVSNQPARMSVATETHDFDS